MIQFTLTICLTIAISPALISAAFQFTSWRHVVRHGNGPWQSSSRIKAETGGLSVSLEKPLGMILEEVEEGAPKGVYVVALNEEGSAFKSDMGVRLVGMALKSVMSTTVSSMRFDEVMAAIVDAPSPVTLELEPLSKEEASDDYPLGTIVPIVVLEGDKETVVEMRVGDNLRLSLLEKGFQVYRGFKSKIGNCGGGGQCTFCAVDFVSDEGWAERSEYEESKLKKSPQARLSCLNNVQGPAAIRLN